MNHADMDWKSPSIILKIGLTLGLAIGCLSLQSCSLLGGKKKSGDDPYGLGAYQKAGGRIGGFGGGGPAAVSVTPATGQTAATGGTPVSGAGITPDSDIVWAPENPEEAMGGGLEELWKLPENKSWQTSYREAAQQSRETGKPMLIWFTDSMHSPLCRKLSDELFSTSDFEGWAMNNVVRMRVDTTIPSKEKHTDLGVRKTKYVEGLKKRFGVHGHPTVMILLPSGAVHVTYRGYKKGTPETYWGQMKRAVVKAQESYGKWREKYEKRGYRLWASRDGRKTFAKLYRFQSGRVTLIDPDGKRGTTSFSKLCDADQTWIMLQKKRHEAQNNR